MAARRPFHSSPAPFAAALVLASAPFAAVSQPFAGGVATDGADILIGGPGPDTLQGLGGSDTLRGLEGPDLVNGNGGGDSVGGGPGDDQVNGGQGADQVNGGRGNDAVSGDRDDDTLSGGLGADLFLLIPGGGQDVATDFDSASGDRLVAPAGAALRVEEGPEGAVVRLASGEGISLRGVPAAAMGDWRATITLEAVRPASVEANPRSPERRWLQLAILALGVLFAGLLGKGIIELVNYRARPPG